MSNVHGTSGKSMKKQEKRIHLLIAERNSRVREFLKSELGIEGYIVWSVANDSELLDYVNKNKPMDLIILDPDLPVVNVPKTLKILKNRVPKVIIVLHAFYKGCEEYGNLLDDVIFVEKQGNSVVDLKQVILESLKFKLSNDKIL